MKKNKVFYYTSKDYLNREYTEIYYRVSRWVRIDYTLKGIPFFRYNNKRYKLDDFLRIDGGSVITDTIKADDAKQVIILGGYESDVYYKPLFIEISDSGEAVRLYKYNGMLK